MRKIFLDCGSNDGCSVRKFRHLKDKDKEFECFCFEGNPKLFKYHPVDHLCKFYPNIVYGSDEVIEFYIQGSGGGSTTSKKKYQGYLDKYKCGVEKVQYQPVILSEFIKNNFSKDDHIILKLDVEGAEYSILQNMIDTQVLSYVNAIYIEWHTGKKTDHENCKGFIKEFNNICGAMSIPIDPSWDAQQKIYSPSLR